MHSSLLIPLLLLAPTAPGDQAPDAEFAERFVPLEGTRPAHWRVTWTTDPATEATVSWSTAESGKDHRVLYSVASSDGEYALVQESHSDGAYTRSASDSAPAAWFHHARLTELEPSTTYRLCLESDGVRSRELSFTTAHADGRPFSFLVGGDSRSGWRARCLVNQTIARLVSEQPDVLAMSHGGDYVMWGDRWDDWVKWLSHHELTTTADGRLLPVIPTRGNHDFGPLFDEVFDAPGTAGLNYYRTRLSPEVSLITLNSNISVAGDQLTWLETELAAAEFDSRWLLASYHRALYPAIKLPGEAKSFWPPLFDKHGVDMVLESDGHCIKRTMPIRGDEPHPEGVVYLGEGGLGVEQRLPRGDHWYLQAPGLVTRGHHVMRIEVSADALTTRILRLPELPERFAPEHFRVLIPPNASWRYLSGENPPDDWMAPEFDASAWPEGVAGFGYGDDDDVTVLEDMRKNYDRVLLRRAFELEAPESGAQPTLMCRYDDAFVAYLNGVEVARASLEPSGKPNGRPKVRAHEARELEAFPLEAWREHLRPGTNVLALVGYNRMRSDRDFTLDPWLAGERLEDPTRIGLELEEIDVTTLAPRR